MASTRLERFGTSVSGSSSRFARDEEGSLVIFGLFCFCMMLVLAGLAVDLMRFEERRTLLQNTVDRASLAAADLQQTLPPKDVVRDYFAKAGLQPPADSDITVTEGAHGDSRKVQIVVGEEMPTWFMKIVGVPVLGAPANSTAEESIGQIEISLVLDVSGSMNSNQRLTRLKPAARNFVDEIFDSAEPGKVSISVIPYATQVAMSDDLISYFNVTQEHTYSNCIEFEDALGDFDTTTVSFGNNPGDRVYQRNGHFDPFYKTSRVGDEFSGSLLNCPTATARHILPFSDDRTAIKNYINNLSAYGNTSIDIGMKWGAALLDPSMQGVVDGMIADGDLPSEFDDRPYAYNNGEVLKVLVLMTDGANTTEYRLRDNYNGNNQSLLVRNKWYRENSSSSDDNSKDQYSLYNPNNNKYYSFKKEQWRTQPYGNVSGDNGYSSGHPQAVPMNWSDVWHDVSLEYFAHEIVRDAYNSTEGNKWDPDRSNAIPSTYIANEKDQRTLDMCNTTKAASPRLRIYTIAFEAPYDGRQLLNACQNAGFYSVEGLDINKAFEGIVNSINKLRLTH
ncbi:MAG: pilus assembly protein TadG-related protein [Paracoccaceae bacterium]